MCVVTPPRWEKKWIFLFLISFSNIGALVVRDFPSHRGKSVDLDDPQKIPAGSRVVLPAGHIPGCPRDGNGMVQPRLGWIFLDLLSFSSV